MTRRLLAMLLLGAFFLATGATRGQEKARMLETPWYPLQLGNKWIYKATYKDRNTDAKCEYRVTAIEEFGGTLCAKVDLFIDGKPQSFQHLSVSETGLYRQGFEGNRPDNPVLLLKLPPKAGETWPVESKATGKKITQVLKGEFTTEAAEIKIGDKTYKTIGVIGKDLDANGLKFTTKSYYAENVGLVKQVVIVGETMKQETVLELEEFVPAKKDEKKEK